MYHRVVNAMVKNKAEKVSKKSQWLGGGRKGWAAILNRMVRKDPTDRVTSQRAAAGAGFLSCMGQRV